MAAMMAVFMLSLGGLPMTGGFIGKGIYFTASSIAAIPTRRIGITGSRLGSD